MTQYANMYRIILYAQILHLTTTYVSQIGSGAGSSSSAVTSLDATEQRKKQVKRYDQGSDSLAATCKLNKYDWCTLLRNTDKGTSAPENTNLGEMAKPYVSNLRGNVTHWSDRLRGWPVQGSSSSNPLHRLLFFVHLLTFVSILCFMCLMPDKDHLNSEHGPIRNWHIREIRHSMIGICHLCGDWK